MRRLLAAAAICLLLAGCGAEYGPERALGRMMNALRDGKFSTAERYALEDSLQIREKNSRTRKLCKALFKSLRYSLAETEVDGDRAEILVTVTAVDLSTLMYEATGELLDETLNRRWNADKRFYDNLLQRVQSGEAATVSSTVTAVVVKTEKGWRVDLAQSPKLLTAITGGVEELVI